MVTPPVVDDSPIIATDPTPTQPEHAAEPVEVAVGCDHLAEEIAELKMMVATLQASGDGNIEANDERIAELESDINELAADLERAEGSLASTQTALTAARTANQTLTTQAQEQRERVRAQLQTVMDELD